MKDEFQILRPLILFSAGLLVLGIVLHACREAAEQRARFGECLSIGARSAGASNGQVTGSKAALRVFPPTSLPGGSFEVTSPAD